MLLSLLPPALNFPHSCKYASVCVWVCFVRPCSSSAAATTSPPILLLPSRSSTVRSANVLGSYSICWHPHRRPRELNSSPGLMLIRSTEIIRGAGPRCVRTSKDPVFQVRARHPVCRTLPAYRPGCWPMGGERGCARRTASRAHMNAVRVIRAVLLKNKGATRPCSLPLPLPGFQLSLCLSLSVSSLPLATSSALLKRSRAARTTGYYLTPQRTTFPRRLSGASHVLDRSRPPLPADRRERRQAFAGRQPHHRPIGPSCALRA